LSRFGLFDASGGLFLMPPAGFPLPPAGKGGALASRYCMDLRVPAAFCHLAWIGCLRRFFAPLFIQFPSQTG
jgi:hypothetical protein